MKTSTHHFFFKENFFYWELEMLEYLKGRQTAVLLMEFSWQMDAMEELMELGYRTGLQLLQ